MSTNAVMTVWNGGGDISKYTNVVWDKPKLLGAAISGMLAMVECVYPNVKPYVFADSEAQAFMSATPAAKRAELTIALASDDDERVGVMVAALVIFLNERAKGYTFAPKGDDYTAPVPATAQLSPPAWMAAPPTWWNRSQASQVAPSNEPITVRVVSMPERITNATMVYDDEGNIASTSQVEKDAV